ncbi:arylacetamide deacetylase [Rousettus aegyptiacus]|uniref:Arylacetamide deacetylase n=1 Tax=Rousettus aegyptiacus TaxID=9407 RepID=A0A7J8HLI7_ROUAE|nr:arylacetamide deacetylase [Rousettus aegyptiacus]KAF6472998.1 arylacetamide deacetylase [Rousettus aegyptiacus]
MGRKSLYLLIVGVLVAYYVYIPLPGDFEDPWKLILLNAKYKAVIHLAIFIELLGLNHFLASVRFFMDEKKVPPTSDENITVTDTTFNHIPVRVYVPKKQPKALRRGIFFIHGGGWSGNSAASQNYDLFSRWTADRLDTVVVSTNHRLLPEYRFPIQFEDVYSSFKWFLRKEVLAKYGVNPERIGVVGCSSGGNLAAAIVQKISDDPDSKIKPKIQFLFNPLLQALDMDTPSYRENSNFPSLFKSAVVRSWSEYITADRSLEKAMLSNQVVPEESSHLLKFVNWSSLLPKRFKKGHVYSNPTYGSSELSKKYPALLDVRVFPLLADDKKLHGLPRTYIITCQYDILRDDGIMYATRLQNAGVPVTHNHIENGVHGLLFMDLKITRKMKNQYVSWLRENL